MDRDELEEGPQATSDKDLDKLEWKIASNESQPQEWPGLQSQDPSAYSKPVDLERKQESDTDCGLRYHQIFGYDIKNFGINNKKSI